MAFDVLLGPACTVDAVLLGTGRLFGADALGAGVLTFTG